MKKLIASLSLVLVVALGVVGFSACKKKSAKTSPVVGVWHMTYENINGHENKRYELEYTMCVFKDGTAWYGGYDGTWSLKNKIFTLNLSGDDGFEESFEMEFKNNQLICHQVYGSDDTFQYFEKYKTTKTKKHLLIGSWKFTDRNVTYTFNDDFTGTAVNKHFQWAQIDNLIIINKCNAIKYENGKLYRYDGVVMEKI